MLRESSLDVRGKIDVTLKVCFTIGSSREYEYPFASEASVTT
jgi:hypothetical protein